MRSGWLNISLPVFVCVLKKHGGWGGGGSSTSALWLDHRARVTKSFRDSAPFLRTCAHTKSQEPSEACRRAGSTAPTHCRGSWEGKGDEKGSGGCSIDTTALFSPVGTCTTFSPFLDNHVRLWSICFKYGIYSHVSKLEAAFEVFRCYSLTQQSVTTWFYHCWQGSVNFCPPLHYKPYWMV